MSKKLLFSTFALAMLCFLQLQKSASAQVGVNSALMTLAGDTSTRFYSMFPLSDGTFLVGGEARSLAWLPNGVPATTLTLPGTTNSASPKIAFILQVSADLKTLVKAVRFPDNTVQNVFKIKTNTPPGQPTGDLFISGSRQNENTATGFFAGYYLAKLNGNFLNGNTPSGLAFLYDVATRPIQSNNNLALTLMNNVNQYKAIQPWDVQSDGKIVFGQGHAYSASWASVNRLNSQGTAIDTVPFWPMQNVRIASNLAAVNGRSTEHRSNSGVSIGDSIVYTSNSLGFSGNVAIDSLINSTLVFKTNRSGSNLRSLSLADFNLTQTDENGNAGRFGKYPEDFMYPATCEAGNCSNTGQNLVTKYETNFGNNDNATHRLGDIVIDRRNNDMYLGYSTLCKHPKSRFQSSDVESIVLAMSSRGQTKWWNRLHKEDSTEGSPAAQEIDGLALDYSNNQLYVAGASLDTCKYNFWKGDELILNPGGSGFQNEFTGNNSNIRFAWLGKMNLSDGKMKAATYVGEYGNDIGQAGSAFSDPIMNGWPNPNTGNPNLDNTRIWGLEVALNGDVLIRGEATRTITTSNAYQRMPKPQQGLAPRNQFVRVYTSDLDSVRFSSSVSLVYEPNLATSSSNVTLGSAIFTQDGIVVSGFANNGSGKLASLSAPAYGDSLCRRKRGLIGRFAFQCDTVDSPTSISGGPAVSCVGGVYTFNIPNPGTQNYVWSYPAGWLGSDSSNSGSTSTLTLKALPNAQAGKITVVKKSNCAVSLPYGVVLDKPLPTSIAATVNPSNTAASYNLPNNSAVWFVNGDTARRANGQAIRTSTIVFAQIVPAFNFLTDSLVAQVTNDCGTFSALILDVNEKLTSASFNLFPNPSSQIATLTLPLGFSASSLELLDVVGRSQKLNYKKLSAQSFQLELGTLPVGIYTLQVAGNKGLFQKRLVKN